MIEKLKNLDNNKLVDIVKNHKQYGYSDEIRNNAISILEERGIDKEHLKLTGNFENQSYKDAERVYNSFRRDSKISFFFYGLIFILNIISETSTNDLSAFLITVTIISWISLILYCIFIIKSFISQNTFNKMIGKDYGISGALTYVFLGMPFYFFMYFVFRKQMNEDMKLIN